MIKEYIDKLTKFHFFIVINLLKSTALAWASILILHLIGIKYSVELALTNLPLLFFVLLTLSHFRKKSELKQILETYKKDPNNDDKKWKKDSLNKSSFLNQSKLENEKEDPNHHYLTLEEKLNTLSNNNGEIQLNKISMLTQNFDLILSLQVDEDKNTLYEFKHATNLIYQAVRDNLHHYCLIMKNIESLDDSILLEESMIPTKEKADLLQERLTLSEKQNHGAKEILIKNEVAISQLYAFISNIIDCYFYKMPASEMDLTLEKLVQQTRKTEQYTDDALSSPYQGG